MFSDTEKNGWTFSWDHKGEGDNLLKGEIHSHLAVLVYCSVHKHS